MRELTEVDLRDIIIGCTLLGTGGGGDPEEGWELIESELKKGKRFLLASLSEVPDDKIVATPYFVGSLGGAKVDPVYPEGIACRAYRLLEEYMGEKFFGVISTELGGANTAVALAIAAELERPVIDADPVGRSVPGLEHSSFYVKGISMTPFSVVSPFGDETIFERVKDDFQAEKLVRAMVSSLGTNVGVCSHPVRGRDLKESVINDAISYSLRLGRALREARESGENPALRLVQKEGAFLLFEGVCVESRFEEKEGFTVGRFALEGKGEFEGRRYEVFFKNENMYSLMDGEIDITIPDLICVVSIDGDPITNPNVKEGEEYYVLGFPAHPIWRSERGLELLGPKYLNLDVEYVPIEKKRGR